MKNTKNLPAVLEVDLKKLTANLKKLKSINPKSEILAMLKGNAYGMGLKEISQALIKAGVKYFGIVGAQEGIILRSLSSEINILDFEPIEIEKITQTFDKQICPVIYKLEDLDILVKSSQLYKRKTSIFLKINTGLNRWGLSFEEAILVAEELSKFTKVRICGLITTLIEDEKEDKRQIKILKNLQMELKKKGIDVTLISYVSSQYQLSTSNKESNLIRLGISLFGVYPDNETKKKALVKLDQVFSLKSQISQVRIIRENEGVLYKKRLVVNKKTKIGILPIGYYFGLPPLLKTQGRVLVDNKFCPILGISMSSTIIDISKVKKLIPNQEVVLLGRQGKQEITIYEWENWTGISRYALMCGFSSLLQRKYIY